MSRAWLFLCATFVLGAESRLKAHALFAHHAVLQTSDDGGAGTRISGTGESGEVITLDVSSSMSSLTVNQATAIVDADGKWTIHLNMTSGGPYTLSLSGSKNEEKLSASDVLFGDVYICSGQSNMVFAIGAGNPYADEGGAQSIENASAEIAAADHPDMRYWFVPSPPTSEVHVPASSPLAKRRYVQENNNKIYVGQEKPLTNLTGGCPVAKMCDKHGKKKEWGCTNECFADDDDLVHHWTAITPDTVGPLSAVCYMAVRNVKQGATPTRPVGIIASYVGGTPVGCWANDMNADSTCNVTPNPNKNVPCDPSKSCCPGHLYNDKVSPLLPFNAKAILWYQGEANTDEGYTRTREEYACQMKLLVTSWRKAWGYDLPFFWIQLHGWGLGGGASDSTCFWGGGPTVYNLDCLMAIRMAQSDVAADPTLPLTGMASAVDCCEADNHGSTCNLHPGFKTLPAQRLSWEIMNSLFGHTERVQNLTQGSGYPKRPLFKNAVFSSEDAGVKVTFQIENNEGLKLQPIHDWEKIWGGVGCKSGAPGMMVINVLLNGATTPKFINGTAAVVDGALVGTWAPPFMDDSGVVEGNITKVLGVRYLSNNVPTCVVVNEGNRPLGPVLHEFLSF